MNYRICPRQAFDMAHNGLNMFLTEYPHMDEKQRAEIRKLIEHFSEPQMYRNKIRRPALSCQMGQDDVIHITSHIVCTTNPIEKKI